MPTAPHAAAVLPTAPSEPPDHVALFNHLVKCSASNVIVAVLHYPALASAPMGCISATKALPLGTAECTCFISTVNLTFADQVDFPWIAEQQGLFNTPSALIKSNILDRSADPEGKPHTKKIKVLPSATSHKVGSEAALALLSQVDVALDAVALAKDDTSVSRANLQKHHDAVNLAAQQQLYTLDLLLQTFKLILAHLQCLDRVLGPFEVDQTGDLFTELQVSPEAADSDSDIELLDPPQDVPSSTVTSI
ncbi:hypothetical protein J132_08281 [Termitomyces sp. J132]|nr:hypothetical protein J132_08281 [Termitomyces sp. J132]